MRRKHRQEPEEPEDPERAERRQKREAGHRIDDAMKKVAEEGDRAFGDAIERWKGKGKTQTPP